MATTEPESDHGACGDVPDPANLPPESGQRVSGSAPDGPRHFFRHDPVPESRVVPRNQTFIPPTIDVSGQSGIRAAAAVPRGHRMKVDEVQPELFHS